MPSKKLSKALEELYVEMAKGSCLCMEIDPSDRPCVTCEAQKALRVFWCPRCERLVSWDNGCLDNTPALCDDCAVFIQALWEN